MSERLPGGARLHRGLGHRTVGLPLEPKLAGTDDSGDAVAATIRDASGGRSDRSGRRRRIETHDCFTPSQYTAIDHFGITAPGRSWEAVESGALSLGGRIPMNPSGGLIGWVIRSVPAGSGWSSTRIGRSRPAGDYQVGVPGRAATLNIGGSTATTVSFVVGRLNPARTRRGTLAELACPQVGGEGHLFLCIAKAEFFRTRPPGADPDPRTSRPGTSLCTYCVRPSTSKRLVSRSSCPYCGSRAWSPSVARAARWSTRCPCRQSRDLLAAAREILETKAASQGGLIDDLRPPANAS